MAFDYLIVAEGFNRFGPAASDVSACAFFKKTATTKTKKTTA